VPTLARLSVPKLVVVVGWPADLFPGRQAAGRALRVVADSLADQIKARLVLFDRSAHNPQVEESDAFNDLLRDTWDRASSAAL
jgi:pimeloyl-ACP methyl ester carboxylesterase